jgi:hypothetical protein
MKPWHPIVRQHIRQWSARLGNLSWWPEYVYHFTDVRNAVNILKDGFLCSREEAAQRGVMVVDNASQEIIQQTYSDRQRYVRLYFRPKTPTQFCNEGFRPVGQRDRDAHCPVPIFFCFDAFDILTRDDCEYSNGNMGAARTLHSGEERFFRNIPFHWVFHNGSFYPDLPKEDIIFHRHAEILIPDHLPLDNSLKMIVCRSSAERQTLLRLLPADIRDIWLPKIRLGDAGFYFRRWTFIEEVVAVDGNIIFRFNPSTCTPGPFDVKFAYKEDGETKVRTWENNRWNLNDTLTINVPNAFSGLVALQIEGAIAYCSDIVVSDIPF